MDETNLPPTTETSTEASEQATATSPDNPQQLKRVLEAVLLSAQQPVSMLELRKVFADAIGTDVLRKLLDEIRQFGEYRTRRLVLEAWDQLESGALT